MTAVGTSSTDAPWHAGLAALQAVRLAEGSLEPTMGQAVHVLGTQ